MKIESYDLGMDSAGTYSSVSTRTLALSVDTQSYGSFADAFGSLDEEQEEENNSVSENSEDAWERFSGSSISAADSIPQASGNDTLVRDLQTFREQLILYLWSMLFGKTAASDMASEYGISSLDQYGNSSESGQITYNVITVKAEQTYHTVENEQVDFKAAGSVTCADGRTIDFDVNLNMTGSFEEYYSEYAESTAQIMTMVDPLVLNFDGDVAGLSDQTFTFDLDADGQEDSISLLSRGNGFLALDKNDDGVINDGSELFGTESGNGFADLAKYDEDGNGWIDENDDIFNQLKIWVKDEDGNDELLTLKDKNVGAIYLGNAQTDFTLRGSEGNVNGAIRKMGIFLYEDGMTGTLSHLDIAN